MGETTRKPYQTRVPVSVGRITLMQLVAEVCSGRWPLSEFSVYDAECLENAARLIRLAAEAK